tara:strand:+ start:1927 stop:2847 length:921 start_codon:yes stop_codon:yes gene_type:complete
MSKKINTVIKEKMETSTEIMFEQMLHMDASTLQNMCRASKRHAAICRDETFWRRKFKTDFGDSIFNKVLAGKPTSWKSEWINETYGKVLYLYPTAQIQLDRVTGLQFDYDEDEDRENEEDMYRDDIVAAIGINDFYLVKLSLPLTDKEKHYYMVTIEEVVKSFLKENADIFKSRYEVVFDGEKFKVTVYPKANSFDYIGDKMEGLSEYIHLTSVDGNVDIDDILRKEYPEEFSHIYSPVSSITKFYDTGENELSEEDFYRLPDHDGGEGTYRQFTVELPLLLDLTEKIQLEKPVGTIYGYEIFYTY